MAGFVDGVKEFYSGFNSVIPVTEIVKATAIVVNGVVVGLLLAELFPSVGGTGEWSSPPKP